MDHNGRTIHRNNKNEEKGLQLGPRSRLFLQGLSIQLVQERAVSLGGRRTLQFETSKFISKQS